MKIATNIHLIIQTMAVENPPAFTDDAVNSEKQLAKLGGFEKNESFFPGEKTLAGPWVAVSHTHISKALA